MESKKQITAAKTDPNDADIEFLIAKYTLEYLYRWTNEFEPAQLVEMRQLLDSSTGSSAILSMMRGGDASMQS